MKLRFDVPTIGRVTAEDLWDLSPELLDSTYKRLSSIKKQTEEDSLLGSKSKENKRVSLSIEIVKHVFQIKDEEAKKRALVRENAEQRRKLLEMIAAKQDKELDTKSVEELQAMVNELEKQGEDDEE
jgi:hypothetical protein